MEKNIVEILELAILSFFIIFILSAITIIVLFLYKKRQIENKNKIHLIRLEFEANVLKSNLEIQEETLYHIAREIHDNISLNLTLSKLYLNTLPVNNDDKICGLIQSSIDLISKSLYDLNNLSKSIDGEMIKRNGLLFSIENEVENLRRIGSFNVQLIINGDCFFLKPDVELLIFRITQETLKNSIIHSCAQNISLLLEFQTNYLIVIIKDDGKGFSIDKIHQDVGNTMSSGISSMRKRAELINAQFKIESTLGSGTITTLTIPITQNDKR